MTDCIFCRIANGDIPVEFVYESADAVAFNDINPQAPVHVLIVTKRHIATILEMSDTAPGLFGELLKASSAVARGKGIDESGFRLILNTNADGGQEVFHVHLHLLGGEPIGPLRAR